MHGCPALLSSSIRSSPSVREIKEFTSPLTESDLELDDIFTWQEPRKVTKNLTITYDKCIYLEPTELNHKLAGQYISFLEYPDGTGPHA
jgi:hypothetical protein